MSRFLSFLVVTVLTFSPNAGISRYQTPDIEQHRFLFHNQQSDTCLIENMAFQIEGNLEKNELYATIKNGRILVFGKDHKESKYRVIRYVFSVRRPEYFSSVRHYGNLVSYPVIELLKDSKTGDDFYFEEIIIAAPSKEILDNAVKPFVLRRN